MNDLGTWLLACIAEDEAAARAASDGRWYVERMEPGVLTDDTRANVLTTGSSAPSFAVVYDEAFGGCSTVDAEHIARWSPAHVLAWCTALRAVVDLHRHEAKGAGPVLYDGSRDLNEGAFGCVICSCVTDDPGWHLTGGWCETLQALAQPYTGREGYDPTWAPSS